MLHFWPSPSIFSYCKQSKTGARKGLRTRLVTVTRRQLYSTSGFVINQEGTTVGVFRPYAKEEWALGTYREPAQTDWSRTEYNILRDTFF